MPQCQKPVRGRQGDYAERDMRDEVGLTSEIWTSWFIFAWFFGPLSATRHQWRRPFFSFSSLSWIMGAAIWLLPKFGMTINSSALLAVLNNPQFYAILFGSIVIVRLICAPYWVRKDERDARLYGESKTHSQEYRKTIRIALGEFFASGRSLMGQCKNEDIPPPIDETNLWIGGVEGYLVKMLDRSYAERFHSPAGIQLTLEPPTSETHKPVWLALFTRISRLHEFFKELPND